MIDENLINSDIDELYRAYAMAKHVQDVEVSIMQKAIVQAFGEGD